MNPEPPEKMKVVGVILQDAQGMLHYQMKAPKRECASRFTASRARALAGKCQPDRVKQRFEAVIQSIRAVAAGRGYDIRLPISGDEATTEVITRLRAAGYAVTDPVPIPNHPKGRQQITICWS